MSRKILIIPLLMLGLFVATASPASALYFSDLSGDLLQFDGTSSDIIIDFNVAGTLIRYSSDLQIETADKIKLSGDEIQVMHNLITFNPSQSGVYGNPTIDLGLGSSVIKGEDDGLVLETGNDIKLVADSVRIDHNLLSFVSDSRYPTATLDFGQGESQIYEDGQLMIVTDNYLDLKPGTATRLGGGYGDTGVDITSTGAVSMNGALVVDGTTTLTGAVALAGALNMGNNIITNIGNAGTDFLTNGGLTLANALTVTTGGIGLTAGNITLQNNETISNSTDDTIVFQGVGGSDNTDLILNLDGTYPSFRSATDSVIGFGEDVYVYYYGGGSQAKLYLFGPGNANNLTLYHNDTDGYLDTSTGDIIFQPNSTYVGINNTAPDVALDIIGSTEISVNLSASGDITFSGVGAGTDDSVVVMDGTGKLYTDEIDSRVWGSTLLDYSSSSANYIAKFSDADTLTNSVIYESSGNLGIGTTGPGAKLDIVKVDTDNAKAINTAVSADTNNDDVYGVYNTVDVGTGSSSSRNASGIYNALTNASSGTTAFVYGMQNVIDLTANTSAGRWAVGTYDILSGTTGNNSLVVGHLTYLDPVGGSGSYGYGVINRVGTVNDDGVAQSVYGQSVTVYHAGTLDTFKGFSVDEVYDPWITGGTGYGLYINLDAAGWTNKYGIYEAGGATNYFKGKVGLNYTNPGTAQLAINGNVGIGTTGPLSKLEVKNGDIRVTGGSFIDDGTTLSVPDYVFEVDYSLPALSELREYVGLNKRLPNMPSMGDTEGWAALSLQGRDMRLLEKIEENVLYIFDLDERISDLEKDLGADDLLPKHLESEDSLWAWIKDKFEDGLLKVKELATEKISSDKIVTKEIEAEKVCLGETCVTEEELKQLLESKVE